MFFEGKCHRCGEVVEFQCAREDKDLPRTHGSEDPSSECDGELKRVPYPRRFAVNWKSKSGKSCFMGPTDTVYKTDTTIKRDVRKTRTVTGPAYRGPASKDRE